MILTMNPQNLPSIDTPPLLHSVHSPESVKLMTQEQLIGLAQEIRETLIRSLSVTGGHLGPNLGVVELSIALHRVFSTPKDKILFDVSHQSYVHKLLTGRADRISTIRQYQGLSGFMKRSESEHDAYGAGHAGTSISAALGICAARDIQGQDFNVIAVAGDAAFTCGTTLEGLNNISQTTKRLIVILNDNDWAIDKNVGALSNYFNSLQTSDTYSWVRKKATEFIKRLGGEQAAGFASKVETSAKGLILPSLLFDKFGLRYFGPINGHDLPLLIKTLEYIKQLDTPVILHIITEKGRGYQPALDNPKKFHGLSSYEIDTGSTSEPQTPTYSEIFGETLADMAEKDDQVVAITAAMPSGTKLDIFKERIKGRLFDVGIAEEHAALFACGLATRGIKPYVAIYSTFMQRCIDMIQHDAALQKLPVKFCMDRAGLSPDDGPTHHGLFDIAMLRCIPDIIMMQPKDEAEFVHMLYTMNEINDAPSIIRYPRGCGTGVTLPKTPQILPIGKAQLEQEGTEVTLISLGNMISIARETCQLLEQQGRSVTLINARFIKPLDAECIISYSRTAKVVCTFEDHSVVGGFGSSVLETLNASNIKTPVEMIAWPNHFIEHGTEPILREKYGITSKSALNKIEKHL
ncbi:MAG: 1-deoxy-D-xylulose-5-phosphate synthase [Akkermansia sp.]